MATRARKLDKIRPFHGTGRLLRIDDQGAADLTQHELAKRLRRPQSFVAKYEGGERRIDVVEFVTICRAIGADSSKPLKSLKKSIGLP